VSRLEFRVADSTSRPTSAWLLVTVAGASLWITGQLAIWAIAAQVLAIAVSLARRSKPFAWQRSALVLDLGLAAVVAVTIAIGLQDRPSTIALAHFAALTQGLQLLDARPRKTEFLLVTLAMFQVILAANLTDSVFFTPLLVATLLATVWTLLVHTLRMEALEAGDAGSVTRAVTPGLLRTTLLASGLSIVLALLLFAVLPRLRSSVVTAASLAPVLSTAGFSESVELGALGRIRRDARVVLRVETLDGKPPGFGGGYWRGLAFDRFDGRTWSITPPGRSRVAGSAETGVSFGQDPDDANLVQRVVREPVAGGVLFGVGECRRLQGTVRRLERDSSGGLYAAYQGEERVRYTIATHRRTRLDERLRRDSARPPRRDGARYLQRPALGAAVAGLAHRIAESAESDADRVRALENWLLRHGRYTDDPPDALAAGDRSPIEAFLLGELAGHCEYFASALVVLARELGIPARLVNGFAGGRENPIGGFVELTRSDAHTWVEIHYERAGWVRYDPTPPDLRARPAAAVSLATRLRDLGSALELWWFQRVVGFDRSDQMWALKEAWLAWQAARNAGWRGRATGGRWSASRWLPDAWLAWRDAFGWLGLAGGLALLVWRLRRHRRRSELPTAYAEALRLLRRRRLERPTAATARDFAQRVATSIPPAGPAFAALTEGYLAARFGGRPWSSAGADLRALRDALRDSRRRSLLTPVRS